MDRSITFYEIKQVLNNDDIDYLLTKEQEKICFFRFIGGNPSETEHIVKQLYRLKENKLLLFVIFRFPYRFEGKKRTETAVEQYYKLKDICDSILYFYSDSMMEILEEGASIGEANQLIEKFERSPIDAIKDMINQIGKINIDVHDLQTFIKTRPGALFVRTFEGNSFDEPLKYLISAPYLPPDFAEGNQMIVNVGYTKDVDMNNFRQINLRLNDLFHKAEIFKLGSYLINEPGSRMKITLIANGISDPYKRPVHIKEVPFYKYWFMNTKDKLTHKNGQSKLMSPFERRVTGNVRKE